MRTPTVTVLVGPPASGKSTYAKLMVSKNPTLVRLNRDDFRMSLFGKEYLSKDEEKRLTPVIRKIGRTYLKAGLSLVLDNTHCNLTTLEQVAIDYNDLATIDYIPFNVDYKELLHRNSNRDRVVPEDVVQRMAKAFHHIYGSFDFKSKPLRKVEALPMQAHPVFVFDIDDTLSRKGARHPYDWKKVGVDIPIEATCALAFAMINSGARILFVTGRNEVCAEETLQWLRENITDSIEAESLYMRKDKDMRKSRIVKEEILNSFRDKFEIAGWFDDDQEVLEMLREYAITTYDTSL